MSRQGILAALKSGPKATSEILLTTGTCSGDVARTCAELRHSGLIIRVDSGSGRGSRAIYALSGSTERCIVAPRAIRLREDKSPLAPAHRIDRDPCFYCGARGDIDCGHRAI